MPILSIAIMLLMASLPFLFAYISFNLWNRYTALGVFFLLLSLGFTLASLGIAASLASNDQQYELSALFTNLIYAIIFVIIITLGAIIFDVLPLVLKKFSEGED